jgi:hypothetical protein
MNKYARGFDFNIEPANNAIILETASTALSESTELVYTHTGINGDFTIQIKLAENLIWTDLYSATGSGSGSFDISRFDDIRILTESSITSGRLVISVFDFAVTNVGTIVGTSDASAANQVTSNNLLTQIELNQDTQSAILNTIASNTSSTPSADIALVDTTSTPNVVYVGEASPGSSQASAVWRITRIDTSGSVITILYADGNTNKDNIWNNRVSGSYS